MHANGGIYLFVLFGNLLDLGKIFQIHANAQGMGDFVAAHACQNLIKVFSKLGEIEVAMRIDKHGGYGSVMNWPASFGDRTAEGTQTAVLGSAGDTPRAWPPAVLSENAAVQAQQFCWKVCLLNR